MPSCADFGVIDQYLFYKDQVDAGLDTGLISDQFDYPEFPEKQKCGDATVWNAAEEKTQIDWRTMEDSSWFLEQVDSAKFADLIPLTPTPTPTTTHTAPPTTFTTTTPTSPTGCKSQSQAYYAAYGERVHCKTFTAGNSGCTVIQSFSPVLATKALPFTLHGNSMEDMHSPDILDLDHQQSRCRNSNSSNSSLNGSNSNISSSSSSSSNMSDGRPRVTIKTEPDCGFQNSFEFNASWQQHNQQQQAFMGDASEMWQDNLLVSIRQEAERVANDLYIPRNPYAWSQQDSQKWVRHICSRFANNCPDFSLAFNVKGSELCRLNTQAIASRVNDDGQLASHLHSSLDILKMLTELDKPETPVEQKTIFFSNYLSENPQLRSVDPYHVTSTSPAPSTGSSASSSSCSSPDDDLLIAYQASQADNTGSHVTASTPAAPAQRGARHGKQTIHLWQFLRELLDDPQAYQSCIKWLDRAKGIFKIEDSGKVAKYWGRRKNRPAMNYDKLSRSVRQYYKKGIIKKTELSKRLVYQFCTPYL